MYLAYQGMEGCTVYVHMTIDSGRVRLALMEGCPL